MSMHRVKDSSLLTFALALSFFLFCSRLHAHHGTAAFDTTKKISLRGAVTQWFWANPHCILEFDAKDDNGELVHWIGEGDNPPNLVNHGWSVNSFKVGDQITVTLEPVKNGKKIGRLTQVVLANGKVLGGVGATPNGAEIPQH